jgi:hypothetical protein
MNFDNLVAVLAVAAAVPLILTAVPLVPVPRPVLEIVAGIVLGHAVLDLVQPDQAVRLVSMIGLAFLLFLAGAALPAGPPGRARTARRPLPVRPRQHPRCRRGGAAPSDVAALHRRRHHHRASVARHQSSQRGCTVAAGLFSVILFPVISLHLLRSSAKGPGMVAEQGTFAGGHIR